MRTYLTLLVLAAVAPALGVVFYSGLERRRSELENARRNGALVVESIANEMATTVAATRALLATVAQSPQIKARDARACNALLGSLLQQNPQLSAISAAGPDGAVFAAGLPYAPYTVADRKYFKDLTRTHTFASGEYVVSRLSFKPTIHFGMPVLDEQGRLLGSVQTGIDPQRFENYLTQVQAPEGATLVITDHAGRILHHSNDSARYEGQPDAPEFFNRMRDCAAGEFLHAGPEDGKRIHFFRALSIPEDPEPYLYVRLGLPEDRVYADARRATARNLGVMGLVLAAALGAAWLLGERRIVRPVRRLVEASQRLAGGDLSVLAGDPHFGGELGQLARSFDEMSQALAAREAERNRALEAMSLTQFAVDRVATPIAWTDADGVRAYANKALCDMLGCTREELVGHPIWEINQGMNREKWRRQFESARERGALSFEGVYFTKAGERRDCGVLASYIEFGEHQFIMSFVRDITGERQAEERLRQAQKMEAIGTLAGGVAHDFNNLLTGILGYANLLTLDSEPGSPTHEAARVIEKAAERAAELTRQLLGFARKGKFLNVQFNVQPLIGEVVTLLGRTLDKNITITQRLRTEQAGVQGDPNQIQQVILNLALNARDAMPGGGELTIESDLVNLDEEYCRIHPQATPGPHVMIAVSDTGAGVPRELQDRIFEPFFTTKESGKGTGMGLAMVYGIVKNHGGSIQLYSEPGQGARFSVYLPASVEADESAAAPAAPARGSGRILLVDDEEIPRALARTMLERLGYTVAACAGGAEALAHYERHHGETDLVILDMIMPGMDGGECYRGLRRLNPRVRALLSSGYSRDGRAQAILDEGMQGFIQKPYRLEELSAAVAAALAREN